LHFELVHNTYRVPALARFDWLEHGFGNRHYPLTESVAMLKQIHSDIVVSADLPGCSPEGDALLSAGCLVGVKTADCLPILLVDERHRTVAAVHAGWRGSVSRIVQKSVQAMSARWGTRPGDLHAALGPAIGGCCYEVGPEVASQFAELFPERRDLDQRAHIDLEEANRRQLLALGVHPERIYSAGLCTFCDAAQFHSFRRDREAAGRMISFIGITRLYRDNSTIVSI
jgi:YfiH family protein